MENDPSERTTINSKVMIISNTLAAVGLCLGVGGIVQQGRGIAKIAFEEPATDETGFEQAAEENDLIMDGLLLVVGSVVVLGASKLAEIAAGEPDSEDSF